MFIAASLAEVLKLTTSGVRGRFGCRMVASAVSEEVAANPVRYLVGPQPAVTFFMAAALAVKLDEVSGA